MNPADSAALLQQLQAKQLITPPQAMQVMQQVQQGGSVVDAVSSLGVDDEEIAKTRAEVFGMPYISLVEREVPDEVLNTIGGEIAKNYRLVPWQQQQNVVSVAMADPHDFQAVEALDFIARRDNIQFQYYVASDASIDRMLKQYESLSAEVKEAMGDTEETIFADEQAEDESIERDAQSAPVSKMISVILRYAVEGAASDVHIEPDEDGTRVRYRVDGVLHTSLQVPKKLHNALIARIKVLANLKLDETRLPQDGRFRMKVDGMPIDFRVSTMPVMAQEKVVLRILAQNGAGGTLEDLGYVDHNLQVLERQIQQPHGMLLVTGPTGSGKSSTLRTILQMLNDESRNIITLEDPVEYNITGISQTQIKPEIELTFARGLRAILRQDPDVIMVGEIRDGETAELAVHAALTGHMLLSTLHTNDAIGAVPRLVDMGIEPFLISSALNVVTAQRLVRKVCQHCKEQIMLPVQTETAVLEELQKIPQGSMPQDIRANLPLPVVKGKGCERCEDTGYKGRLAIVEVLEITPRMQEIITAGHMSDAQMIDEELKRQGMVSMKQDGIIKALRGLTTIEEVWTTTQE